MPNINLANAVSFLLDECNVSETEICRQTNLPRATLYRLKEGLVDPRLSTLKTLSDYFKIRIDQLIGDEKINKEAPCKLLRVPIVHWNVTTLVHAEKNISKNNFLIFETDETEDEDRYIALQTFSDAMSPNFPLNTTIIVDKKRAPKNQDYVIAAINNSKDAVLRRLLVEGETKILQATNSAFPPINLVVKNNIIGVVIQARNNF